MNVSTPLKYVDLLQGGGCLETDQGVYIKLINATVIDILFVSDSDSQMAVVSASAWKWNSMRQV